MRPITLTVALAVLASCSHGPTAPSRACRKWPHDEKIGAVQFVCRAFPPTNPGCDGTPVNFLAWTYRTQFDFVHEADVPNRILAQSREITGCASFGNGCYTSVIRFEHDSLGRLVRHERRWSYSMILTDGEMSEVVRYTAWDRHGRPTQGQVEHGGETTPLTIAYDDVRRVVQASNGEVVEQDAYGNVIREAWVENGSSFETLYAIGTFQDVCEGDPEPAKPRAASQEAIK